ncbi:MAG: DUF3024 domain-containing protein [bacterium]|nr:DUF3024 domain-containing protein [bacterium]
MAILEIKRAEAERDLRLFCETFVPLEVRDQLRYTFSIRGNDITLFEERPPWDGSKGEWTQVTVARFRYDPEDNVWLLRWQRANGRWLPCDWFPGTARFREALEEVKRDPHGTFFG